MYLHHSSPHVLFSIYHLTLGPAASEQQNDIHYLGKRGMKGQETASQLIALITSIGGLQLFRFYWLWEIQSQFINESSINVVLII